MPRLNLRLFGGFHAATPLGRAAARFEAMSMPAFASEARKRLD